MAIEDDPEKFTGALCLVESFYIGGKKFFSYLHFLSALNPLVTSDCTKMALFLTPA